MASTPAQPAASRDEDEIDLARLFTRLWANKGVIAAISALAFAGGLLFFFGTAPTYRADALLQLEEKKGQLALPAGLSDLAGSEPTSATEIEILRSRLVLGQAVADAHLDWTATPRRLPLPVAALVRLGIPLPDGFGLAAYARGGERIRIDLLEVPPTWIGREIALRLGEAGTFTVTLPDGRELAGQTDVLLTLPEERFALRIGEIDGPPGREFLLGHINDAAAIEALRRRLSVAERGRQTGILELGLTGSNPAETERVLQAIADAYLRQNVGRSSAEADSSLEFVESQLPDAEAAVRRAEGALNDYRQKQQAIDLGFEGQNLLTQISTLEAELQQLADKEGELAERYTPDHPSYQQLLATRARLEERIESLRAEVSDLPETQRVVFNLTRDLELAQEVYVQLLNRAQELRVLRASSIGNVRIIDPARTAPEPIAPRGARILALSLVLGLGLGIGYVLLRGWLRKGVQSAEEIDALGLPVFATINMVDGARDHRKLKGKLPVHAIETPNDLAIEGFRSLRTSLHFGLIESQSHSILITSAAPDAGKSFTAVNLAVVAAQAGRKVCLIDADLRRGYLRRYFGLPKNMKGLSDYLAGTATLEEIMIPGPVPGLFFIPAGRFPPNPSELLLRRELAVLLKELDRQYDLTVVDAPPVLAVTDPIIIGRSTGAAIAVVRFDQTPAGEIEALKRQFLNAGIRLSGAVLNGFDPRRAALVAGYGYGYSYRYGYRERREQD
ncbi:polysaccharide biosynthesis tyrosine autokinase [Tabrizicola soli]|uniref:Polysaccharide biosynthesis tyrosine autokinase n=1 Tax=Tabrizicola soli TaxID=2185115 RepID=A0ABV7DXN5_9RHOB|nr:polysaccharide biosynthesis tyrosine autokinase [Tabrizicola soli]